MTAPDLVRLAKRIRARYKAARRREIRPHQWNAANLHELQGACAPASLDFAMQSARLDSLRMNYGHVWNEVDGLTVDITATQFNEDIEKSYRMPSLRVRGVYVATTRHPIAHCNVARMRGRSVVGAVVRGRWYEEVQASYDGKEWSRLITQLARHDGRAYQKITALGVPL